MSIQSFSSTAAPHPAALLVLSLCLLASVQFWPMLNIALLSALILIASPAYRQKWASFIRRNRWLILSLLIVLSYGLPGEGLGGIDWFPSAQGLTEAFIQSWRLIAMLGILACLMTHCQQQALLLGLHTLLHPLSKLGLPTERSIVRLSLVLAALDKPVSQKQHWQTELQSAFSPPLGNTDSFSEIDITGYPWRPIDSALSVLALAVLLLSAYGTS